MIKQISSIFSLFTRITVVKNFFIYSFGAMLLRGMTFLLAPVMMHVLTPDDYGLLALANGFINVLIAFIGLGLRQVFWMEFFHHDSAKRKTIANEIILIYVAIATPLLLFFICHLDLINHYAFWCNATPRLIIVCLLTCYINFFVELLFQVLRYQCRAFHLTIVHISAAAITVLLNLFFVFVLEWNAFGILLGNLIGSCGIALHGMYEYFKKDCHLFCEPSAVKRKCLTYLKRGMPFIPSMLFAWILASADRWVLAKYAPLRDVGIYSIADTFGQLFHLLVLQPLSGSYLPHLFNRFAENKDQILSIEQWNQKIMYISMTVMIVVITLGFIIFKPLLFWILPPSYQEAINYIWLLLMSYIFLMGTYFASGYIQFLKRTYFLAFSLCLPAAINISLNHLLIPTYNIYGCVIATLIAYIIYFGITLVYNFYLQRKNLRPE